MELLVVVANCQEDSRQRILLVKNRITDIRASFCKRMSEEAFPRKDVIFYLRTVEKTTNGLCPDPSWMQVQLETLCPQKNSLEDGDFLLQPLSCVLSDEILSTLFDRGVAKAMSLLTLPSKTF